MEFSHRAVDSEKSHAFLLKNVSEDKLRGFNCEK